MVLPQHKAIRNEQQTGHSFCVSHSDLDRNISTPAIEWQIHMNGILSSSVKGFPAYSKGVFFRKPIVKI